MASSLVKGHSKGCYERSRFNRAKVEGNVAGAVEETVDVVKHNGAKINFDWQVTVYSWLK